MSKLISNPSFKIYITTILIACLLLTGCTHDVRFTIEKKTSGDEVEEIEELVEVEEDKDSGGLVISDKVFRPTPEQVADGLWAMPIRASNCVIDFAISGDDLYLLECSEKISAFNVANNIRGSSCSAIGRMTTPESPQAVRIRYYSIEVLQEGRWSSTSISWHPRGHVFDATWYEQPAPPDDIERIIDLANGSYIYVLKNNRLAFNTTDLKHYPEVTVPGQVTDALLVGKDRLITAIKNNGVYLHFPIGHSGSLKEIKIIDGLSPECISYDGQRLILADNENSIHIYQSPDSWSEERLWDEIASLQMENPVTKIHPFQYSASKVYMVSHNSGPCQLIGFDSQGKLIPGGILGTEYNPMNVELGPCVKFVNHGAKTFYALGADKIIYKIEPAPMRRDMSPVVPPPAPYKTPDKSHGKRQDYTVNAPSISGEPLKLFEPGMSIKELDHVEDKLICRGDSGIGIYDITEPGNPVLERTYFLGKAANGTMLERSPGMFALGEVRDLVKIYDLLTPDGDLPLEVASMELPEMFTFFGAYERNCVLLVFSNNGDAAIFDVIDPTDPRFLGTIPGSIISRRIFDPASVGYSNGLFYTTDESKLYEINPFGIGGPDVICKYDYRGDAVIIRSGYIYMPGTSNSSWLRKFTDNGWMTVDVPLPNLQIYRSTYRMISDDKIMTALPDGIAICDIANMLNISPVVQYKTDKSATDLLIYNQHLYCAYYNEGIEVFKIPEKRNSDDWKLKDRKYQSDSKIPTR